METRSEHSEDGSREALPAPSAHSRRTPAARSTGDAEAGRQRPPGNAVALVRAGGLSKNRCAGSRQAGHARFLPSLPGRARPPPLG
eukprot:4083253-Pyramimonas_sp.AAC.1